MANEIQPIIIDADYKQWLQQLKMRYRQAQIKAASRVNEELLRYYWQLGADIDARGDENRYGAKFYDMLSHDLMEMMPGVEGFTRKNLQNATRFYRFYSTDENQKQLVSISQDEDDNQNRKQPVSKLKQTADETIFRIPWGHHIQLLLLMRQLEGNQQQPIGISTYRISDLLPTDKQISDRIHQLEQELERLRKLQQKNI